MPTPSWIDVSVPLKDGMVHWPGDPAVWIRRTKSLDHGHVVTFSVLSMGSHTGTHMDAPGHFLRGGRGIDRMPLDATIGSARVIAIRNPQAITPDELRQHRIRRGERVLFKTTNSSRGWPSRKFLKDFVALSEAAARWLAARRVKTIGIDYLSIGGYRDDGPAIHRVLLKAGIWIIEGLDLSGVKPGQYELICLPLRIHRGDGAPARVVLKSLSRSR